MPGFTPVVVALALAQADAAPPAAAERPAAPEPAAATAAPTADPASTSRAAPRPAAPAIPTAPSTSTPTPTATSSEQPLPAPAPAPRPRLDPVAERGEAERAARAFLGALAARDAEGLAAAAADRFSFDGDLVSGREAVRSTWRALLAGRPGPAPKPGTLEVLPAQEAVARHGPPPARIAPLVRPGAFVAVGDVGGRTVVLLLAREGGRMAVLGMHD